MKNAEALRCLYNAACAAISTSVECEVVMIKANGAATGLVIADQEATAW